MKNTILILFLLVFVSCSRDGDEPTTPEAMQNGYFITYKSNGNAFVDNEVKNPLDNSQYVLLGGSRVKLNTASTGNTYDVILNFDMIFTINSYPLKVQQYVYDETKTTNPIKFQNFGYKDSATGYTYSNYFSFSNTYKNKFTVNVTEIGSNFVKGTFTGNFIAFENYMQQTNSKIVNVTDGSFKIPLR